MHRLLVITTFVLGCGPATSGPSATSSSAAAAAAPKPGKCYSAEESQRIGSVTDAAPPFEACARQLKVHCGGEDGERGGLRGLPLLVPETTEARVTRPDACCYAACD